ncbi:Vacuolar protein sorting-associated protein [Parasponia andersonii]|uniref:Vacuolar protein sorting-associated protein n=1 Tax=Parasponia andersonii TaxID=3476 RepID=A0A2P5ATV1_PARAD|nr:Vacuolar protein sorting-associated protein [Parasponia andersonii]
MGNCLTLSPSQTRDISKKSKVLPIENIFKLPSPIPSWPQGEGFAKGTIDLGDIEVSQISTFNKVWSTHEGGPDNLGATFFEPSPIPEGFHILGYYSQPNNKPLFGWALVAKDNTNGSALTQPTDYALVWSSESLKIKQDGNGYLWLPTAPDGYKAAGFVVTDSPEKPPLHKVRCIRSDLTEPCEVESWLWGQGQAPSTNADGFDVYSLRPTNRGAQALGVRVGTFVARTGGTSAPIPLTLACLKNVNPNKDSSMPNLTQLEAIFLAYSPLVYLHPDEKYLPSSVNWYFANGALLYKNGDESQPIGIEPNGSNLPQGGANDGSFWLDLPVDKNAKERVKKGDLSSAQVYLHAKPMLGSTFTDLAMWIFYPFNGPARAKVEFLNISLGKIGEHIGDWEHLTLRVSNFTGELWILYFSEHSKGKWVEASELEFSGDGSDKPVAYASLNGHAFYEKPGLVLQGSGGIGIRNDTAKSKLVMNTAKGFAVVAGEYLGSAITEPPWVNYLRKWGPKIDYDTAEEVKKIEKVLPGKLKSAFEKFVNGLPDEIFGEDGPTGPKVKASWSGDEAI